MAKASISQVWEGIVSGTTPIENVLNVDGIASDDYLRWCQEYSAFCRALPRNVEKDANDLRTLHTARLGKHSRTFRGEHRMWVWETLRWTIYANNHKGICFEVPRGTTREQAWEAWREYRTRMLGTHTGGA